MASPNAVETRRRSPKLELAQGADLCRMRRAAANRRAFATVAAALLVLMCGVNLPTPLYGLYRAHFEFSPLAMTFVFAIYIFSLIPALLVFGPLGDAVGRRRVLVFAVIAAAAGAAVLAAAQSLVWLLAGRAIQGVALGAAVGNAAAALVELEPAGDKRRAGLVTTVSAQGGAALGPLVGGVLAEYLPLPRLLAYLVELALLVILLIALVSMPLPRQAKAERLRLHRPRVPRPILGQFASASLSSALVWGMAGLFLSLVPTYAASILDSDNLAVAGAVVALMLGTSGMAQLALRGQPPQRLQVGGLLALVAGLTLVIAAHPASSAMLLFLGALAAGGGLGAAFLGAVTTVNEIAPAAERGNVTSLFFALTYLGTALPSLGVGLAATSIGLYPAVRDFGIVVGALALLNVAWLYSDTSRSGHSRTSLTPVERDPT